MKKIIAVVLSALIFTTVVMILSQHVQPQSGLYPFKRLYEKVVFITKRGPQEKAAYYSELLSERLSELYASYHSTDKYTMLSSSLRYSTTAGNLANIIKANKLVSESTKASNLFIRHQKSITALKMKYPSNEAKYLDDDIHYLEFYMQQLDEVK